METLHPLQSLNINITLSNHAGRRVAQSHRRHHSFEVIFTHYQRTEIHRLWPNLWTIARFIQLPSCGAFAFSTRLSQRCLAACAQYEALAVHSTRSAHTARTQGNASMVEEYGHVANVSAPLVLYIAEVQCPRYRFTCTESTIVQACSWHCLH